MMKSIDTMLHFLYLPPLDFDLWIMFGITHCGIYEFSTIDKGSLIPDQQALVGYLIGPQCVAKHEKNTDQVCAILLQEQRW